MIDSVDQIEIKKVQLFIGTCVCPIELNFQNYFINYMLHIGILYYKLVSFVEVLPFVRFYPVIR